MPTPFHLQIATPDGSIFDGQATRIIVRTIDGDVCIMAGHTNYCSALGMGTAKLEVPEGEDRYAACMGGMISVISGETRLVATTWEWKEDIDADRAHSARERAEERLKNREHLSDKEIMLAEAKLKRALIRSDVAGR